MNEAPSNIFTRDDTFFGVCQALGEDLGFPPNLLRIALALGLFFSPLGAIAAYAAAGVVVAFSRWMVPGSGRAGKAASSAEAPASVGEQAENEADLAIAA